MKLFSIIALGSLLASNVSFACSVQEAETQTRNTLVERSFNEPLKGTLKMGSVTHAEKDKPKVIIVYYTYEIRTSDGTGTIVGSSTFDEATCSLISGAGRTVAVVY